MTLIFLLFIDIKKNIIYYRFKYYLLYYTNNSIFITRLVFIVDTVKNSAYEMLILCVNFPWADW